MVLGVPYRDSLNLSHEDGHFSLFLSRDNLSAPHKFNENGEETWETCYPAQIGLTFDLRKGWEPQAKQAKEIFLKIQAYLKMIKALDRQSFQYHKFPKYLRFLDGPGGWGEAFSF